MIGGFSAATTPHHPVLAIPLAGEGCFAFDTVYCLNVCEIISHVSLSEGRIGSSLGFAARASGSLKSGIGLA
jgi:hypothetical protein